MKSKLAGIVALVASVGWFIFGAYILGVIAPFQSSDREIETSLSKSHRLMRVDRLTPPFFMSLENQTSNLGYQVSVGTVIPQGTDYSQGRYVSVAVPPSDWERFQELQRAWCTDPPSSLPRREDAYYVLGFRCGFPNGTRIWYLTKEQLPVEVEHYLSLLEGEVAKLPSP